MEDFVNGTADGDEADGGGGEEKEFRARVGGVVGNGSGGRAVEILRTVAGRGFLRLGLRVLDDHFSGVVQGFETGDDRAETKFVIVIEGALCDGGAVDVGAVRRAEVLDEKGVVFKKNLGVVTADRAVLDEEGVIRAAADGGFVLGKIVGDLLAFGHLDQELGHGGEF